MDLQLDKKCAIITGASKGIGLSIAKTLRAEGCHLVLVSRSINYEVMEDKLRGHGNSPFTVVSADISDPATPALLAKSHPDVDILVNNAGAVPMGSLEVIGDAQWREAWDLKVFGYINMCRAYYPLMKQRGGGQIINIAGIGAVMRNAGTICVSSGNSAIVSFSQALASASHIDRIRVNVINPGPVATERFAETRLAEGNETMNMNSKLPFSRPAYPVEVASLVAFIASERSSYTNGAVINIDGGMSSGFA